MNNKQTHHVEITFERTYRMSKRVDLNDDDYTLLLEGDPAPLFEQNLFKDLDCYPADEDYTMFDLDTNKQVVDWK